jgi:hypothetical protein
LFHQSGEDLSPPGGKRDPYQVEYPSLKFQEDFQRPKVEVVTFSLEWTHPEKPSILNQIFGLKEELAKADLNIILKREIFTKIAILDSTQTDSLFFRCSKLPSDMDARIGVL